MRSFKQYITEQVKLFFEKMRPSILGPYDTEKDGKIIAFTTGLDPFKFNLQKIFLDNLQKRPDQLTEEEKQVLDDLLDVANQYINKLEIATLQNIKQRVVSYLLQSRLKKMPIDIEHINGIIDEELDSALNHFVTIAAAEGAKAKNMGVAFSIARYAAINNIEDPTVFFVTAKDDKVCEECKRLHLLPDGVTPRVWKFSELKFTYHKKGENNPSVNGLHPFCRCYLTVLPKGYGFDANGQIKFISLDHDEYKKQRGL